MTTGIDARRARLLSETTEVAFKSLPSPLKAGAVGAGVGLFIGLIAGHPVKFGVIGAGLTFLGALAIESAFMTGVGVGCVACSTDHVTPKGHGPSSTTSTGAWTFDVFRAQALLSQLGYHVESTGTIDQKTIDALKQFQTTYALQKVDGSINSETMAYLQMAVKQQSHAPDPTTGLHHDGQFA